MTKEEMKNRISMALKDPILQQGFEIICKDIAISEHDREHNDYELTEVYKKVEQLEKEKCELLGIIQGKDKVIKDLRNNYDAFKDGAEFGYQEGLKTKINVTTISDCPIKDEWQYVSEKGTPKTEGHYLVCLRNKDKDILDCWILYDKDVGWYSMQIRIKDIYAWKEIMPPELPKESAE